MSYRNLPSLWGKRTRRQRLGNSDLPGPAGYAGVDARDARSWVAEMVERFVEPNGSLFLPYHRTVSDTSRRIDGVGPRAALRWVLGGALIVAGVGHLTTQRTEFQAQVPGWFPIDEDIVVIASGIVEIALGVALIGLARHRVVVGTIVAAFFVVIFPGNVAQWAEGVDAFGLDTDAKRFARLFFQPVLVIWALGTTGAWRAIRDGTWPTTPGRTDG